MSDTSAYSIDDAEDSQALRWRYEQLIDWGEAFWAEHYPTVPHTAVWSQDGPASPLAHQRIKAGRKLAGKACYVGFRTVPCRVAPRIHHFYKPGRKVLLQQSTGAFVFTFERNGTSFDVLYVSANYNDSPYCTIELAFVPEGQLEPWNHFEQICQRAGNYLERSSKVYVIGAREKTFEPKLAWDDVILSDTLKADIRADMEGFFKKGVPIYRDLGLAPFRKLLFVGPPGTGKSSLCVALAKVALDARQVVVYISSSVKDPDETNFDNVHRALRTASTARFPVLLIIEDLDAYLMEKDEKSQILNVLDGIESPNNRHGVLLVATTNFPEIIDERIAKRPGRVDRIFYIPPIEDESQALRMLKRYMGTQWRDEHHTIAKNLVGKTGVFVREMALCARILAANANASSVSVDVLRQTLQRLQSQLATDLELRPKRAFGFEATESYTQRPDFTPNR